MSRMIVQCNSCRAEIIWIKTPAGKNMPVDATASDSGTVEIVNYPDARIHNKYDAEVARIAGKKLYTSHFATCPNARQHRRS